MVLELDQNKEQIETVTLLGNEAIAYGLRDASVKFAAAYPGTPSTEIMETIISRFGDDMVAGWSSNEAVAFEEAVGASITGVDSVTICKSVGLNVAMDPLMTLALTGTNAALVVVVADDPGMHSSQNEQDNRIISRFADLPMFEPSNIQECYDFTREAVLLSRKFKIPVFVRSVTRISHSLGLLRRKIPIKLPKIEYERNPQRYVNIPGNARRNKSRMMKLKEEMYLHLAEKKFYDEIQFGDKPDYLVVTSGSSANYVMEAIEFFGLNALVLKLNIVYPFPDKRFIELAEQHDRLLIIEELEPFIEKIIHQEVAKVQSKIKYYGKFDGLTSFEGELTTEKLLGFMSNVLGLEYTPPKELPKSAEDLLRIRPPVLCAGCPHRSTYVAVEKALKKDNAVYCNDIGCYSLGVLPPHDKADMLVCMGASIPMATSIAMTQPEKMAVAFIGDSTFWHSGTPGLANAIWKNANILVIVMDNSTTAMTGAQGNPSANHTLNILNTAEAMGAWTKKVNPMDYKGMVDAINEAKVLDGVKVIVSEYPCALNLAKENKLTGEPLKIAIINEENCNGCSLCIDPVGCPALSLNERHIAEIDPALCTGCMYCADHCRRDAIHLKELN